jgi:hypothetical protein
MQPTHYQLLFILPFIKFKNVILKPSQFIDLVFYANIFKLIVSHIMEV